FRTAPLDELDRAIEAPRILPQAVDVRLPTHPPIDMAFHAGQSGRANRHAPIVEGAHPRAGAGPAIPSPFHRLSPHSAPAVVLAKDRLAAGPTRVLVNVIALRPFVDEVAITITDDVPGQEGKRREIAEGAHLLGDETAFAENLSIVRDVIGGMRQE